MIRKKPDNSLLSLIVITLVLVSVPVHAVDEVKVTMGANSSYYAPYLVAIQKGYYSDAGIEVERIKANAGTATPALISGQVQISTSATSTLSASLRGAPLKIQFLKNVPIAGGGI